MRLAIDGPAASGKSAVGSAVADKLGFPFIDTGGIYRGLTWLALSEQIPLDDAAALTELAARATVVLRPEPARASTIIVNGLDATPYLRGPEVEQAVSIVSAVPGVRAHLVAIQRSLANGCCVMAGRDIGSVVLPDAELKVFLDASPEQRAKRREQELRESGRPADYKTLVEQMRRRDFLDSSRPVAPLRPAHDAIRLFTDHCSLPEVIEQVLNLAYEQWPQLVAPRTTGPGPPS